MSFLELFLMSDLMKINCELSGWRSIHTYCRMYTRNGNQAHEKYVLCSHNTQFISTHHFLFNFVI